MSTVTIAEAREHLDELCASVAETGEPVRIERAGQAFMLIPESGMAADSSLVKRILGTPENERGLREAIARAHAGSGIEMTIDELRRYVGLNEAEV